MIESLVTQWMMIVPLIIITAAAIWLIFTKDKP
jgi:hypothetical protein